MPVTAPYDRLHEVDDFGELDPAWSGTRMEWMEVAGVRTRLLRRDWSGPSAGVREQGPTVVLVHGLGGSATNWLEVMAPLAAIGDVVALDLAGFGETAPPRPTSPRPAANARLLATLLHALDVGPVVLVGNSMGGLVSTLVAGEHPALVDRLVLLCPALPPWIPHLRLSRYQVVAFGPFLVPGLGSALMRRRARRMSFEEQYTALMQGIVTNAEEIPERMVQVGVANLARLKQLRWRGAAFREATLGLLEHQAGPARWRTIRAMEGVEAPTLYVRGGDDPLVLDATTSMVERVRPDWVVEIPDGIGHVPMIEDPQWTARRITAFVREGRVTPLPLGQ